ncbi:hypothetical protein HanRHA438_Chr10g0443921 [Helianthus annuus]|uniref:Uncharacterized protein n=1 Tax=Helianthus annuus TaxID=4232 RepID=A0A9K3N3A0_HELAN|nr:hypothetical protein HanXRQr2_Chr10g0431441 [Helianthus annuus]KAJ0513197.1 hypothetical protein HanHA300_Chr10g0354771 [Helianthus annuus]KAJ0520953.1 hypothetical protein HanIR_Chr10g0465241 [Helianthus annuus]KAJ0529321.1 hypothetical protein HanHA89_Chr10g0376461 [Helianthus annuus]KAJ0696206.1 hypothetical protein HanLR1_Chr10g0354351 [Helianthus annuus]
MNSGNVVWSQQLGSYDIFYVACLVPNNPDCAPGPNLDADFGEAPMLLTITSNRRLRDIFVAVQRVALRGHLIVIMVKLFGSN